MKQRKYFDISTTVGRKTLPQKDFPHSPQELTADMANYRIHGALALNAESIDYSYVAGNRTLPTLLEPYNDRLFGVAALPSTALFETGDELYFDKLLASGIKAFMVCPRRFYCSFAPRDMEKTAEFLIKHNIPLLIRFSELLHVELSHIEIEAFLNAFPEVKTVLLDSHWSFIRFLYPMLERHSNLYFDISSNQASDILKTAKEHFGIERVLFGTDWPQKSIGAIKSLIEYSTVSEKDKDFVAHGNACRLLNIKADTLKLYDDKNCRFDAIAAEADSGQPISVPVIDAHGHLIPKEDVTSSNGIMLDSDGESMSEIMNRLGIDTMIISPWQGLFTDGSEGNKQVIQAASENPGRYLGYSTCNVHYKQDQENWLKSHDTYPEVFVGIKPYWPTQKFDLRDEICREWLEYANANKLLALIHTDDKDSIMEQAEEICVKYPDITFILAHSGLSYAVARRNIEFAKRHPNVVLDPTYTSCTRGLIEFIVKELGADRLIFGSDMPMRDPAPQLGWVCYADISVEDKKKILAGNINRLLKKRS